MIRGQVHLAAIALLSIAQTLFAAAADVASDNGPSPAGMETLPTGAEIVEHRLGPVKILFRMDVNRDGVLEKDEIPEGAESFVTDLARQAALDSNRPLDLNQLPQRIRSFAQVSLEELRKGTIGEKFSRQAELESNGVFTARTASRLFDVNGDGVVDERESAGMLDEHREGLEAEAADRLMEALATCKHLDANRDGMLDPSEVPDPIKPYIRRIGQKLGVEDFDEPWRLYGLEVRLKHLASSIRRGKTPKSTADDSRSASGSASDSTQEKAAQSDVAKQYAERNIARKYARSILSLYDKNADGVLEKKEWLHLSSVWGQADRNRNGELTTEEIANRMIWYKRSEARSSDGGGTDSRTRTTPDRRTRDPRAESDNPKPEGPEELPAWFVQRDANGDGQIQISEFIETWNEVKIAEFFRYDLNNDGVLTQRECLTTADPAGKAK